MVGVKYYRLLDSSLELHLANKRSAKRDSSSQVALSLVVILAYIDELN